mgnify:CR=1 FL=1|jgi:hypothetical protein
MEDSDQDKALRIALIAVGLVLVGGVLLVVNRPSAARATG